MRTNEIKREIEEIDDPPQSAGAHRDRNRRPRGATTKEKRMTKETFEQLKQRTDTNALGILRWAADLFEGDKGRPPATVKELAHLFNSTRGEPGGMTILSIQLRLIEERPDAAALLAEALLQNAPR